MYYTWTIYIVIVIIDFTQVCAVQGGRRPSEEQKKRSRVVVHNYEVRCCKSTVIMGAPAPARPRLEAPSALMCSAPPRVSSPARISRDILRFGPS